MQSRNHVPIHPLILMTAPNPLIHMFAPFHLPPMNCASVTKDPDQIQHRVDFSCNKSLSTQPNPTHEDFKKANWIFNNRSCDFPCPLLEIRSSARVCLSAIYFSILPPHFHSAPPLRAHSLASLLVDKPSPEILSPLVRSLVAPAFQPPCPFSPPNFFCCAFLAPGLAPDPQAVSPLSNVFFPTAVRSCPSKLFQASAEAFNMDRSEDCLHCRDLQAEIEQVRAHQ